MADEQKKPEETGGFFGFVKDGVKSVLIPAIKSAATNMLIDSFYAAADTAKNITERQMWKDSTPPPGARYSRGSSSPQQTNYANRYRGGQPQQPQTGMPQPDVGMRSSTQLQYVVAPNREKAEQWKNELVDAIRRYGKVSVSTLYEKTENIKPLFQDFNYGWTKEADIHYVRNADGFWFNLPTPEKIK